MSTTLTSPIVFTWVGPNEDGSGTYRLLGQVISPLDHVTVIGEFIIGYSDPTTASLLVAGTSYDSTLTIP